MTLTAPQALNLWRVALVESLRRGGPDLTEAALPANIRAFQRTMPGAQKAPKGAVVAPPSDNYDVLFQQYLTAARTAPVGRFGPAPQPGRRV